MGFLLPSPLLSRSSRVRSAAVRDDEESEYGDIDDWADYADSALSVGWYWSDLEGSDFAPSGYMTDPLGFGYVVDEDMSLVDDGTGAAMRMDAADVPHPVSGVNRGYYQLSVPFYSILFL